MIKQIVVFTLIVILPMTSGCDSIHERLSGRYILIAVDSDEELVVAREYDKGLSVGRIGPVVTDVGWDGSFITAAVRPPGKPGTPPSYYYLEIGKDSDKGNQFQAVTGPLSKSEFDIAKQQLGLPSFSRHFEHLR